MSHYSDFMASIKLFSERGLASDIEQFNFFISQEPERMRKRLISECLLPLVPSKRYITSFFADPKRLMFVWGRELLDHSIPLKHLQYFVEQVKNDGVSIENVEAFWYALTLQVHLYKGMALERLRIFGFQLNNLQDPDDVDGATLRSFHALLCNDRARMRGSLSLRAGRSPGDCLRITASLESQIRYLEHLVASKKGP